jgi:hypothetical protein
LRGAIALEARSPSVEIATLQSSSARGWDAALIVFGMIGLAIGAFEWSALRAFGELRAHAVSQVVEHGPMWLLADNAPWWLLTHYPQANDVFTWLDGALIAGWIVATALLVGAWVWFWLVAAARALPGASRANAFLLCYALIPLAGAGLFVGLTSLTATLAHNEGLRLDGIAGARTALLIGAAAWSVWLADRQLRARIAGARRAVALTSFIAAVAGVLAAWVPFAFRVL